MEGQTTLFYFQCKFPKFKVTSSDCNARPTCLFNASAMCVKFFVASMLQVSSLSEFCMSLLYSDWMEFLNAFQAQ